MSIGYCWLKEHFQLLDYPLPVSSQLGSRMAVHEENGLTIRTFTSQYIPKPEPIAHLEFALKYEGVNLPVLSATFRALGTAPIEAALSQTPSGKYTRLIGFYYEFCTGETLDPTIEVGGNYVPALEESEYVTLAGKNSTRWRVRNNLLGSADFCPMVRQKEGVPNANDTSLQDAVSAMVADLPLSLLERAADYLYLQETKSTYRIEREEMPKLARMTRFLGLLHSGGSGSLNELLSEEGLVERQHLIVDPRYAETGFRVSQNYVGETQHYREKVHYICPPPAQVSQLMTGLRHMAIESMSLHPVIQAALVSFAFVFIHPFEDGNGRLHRFLIHDLLHRRHLVPKGLLLPVSATMSKNLHDYDRALESFSWPLVKGLARFEVDENGALSFLNGTELADYYRFPDMTAVAIYLAATVKQTIQQDFAKELQLIQCFDLAREQIRDIVDMPDRRMDLLLRYLYQNRGVLANRKRGDFAELTDAELMDIQSVFQEAFQEMQDRS